MVDNVWKTLAMGLILIGGGFGVFIVSLFSLIPFSAYFGIVGTGSYIVGLGITALAVVKFSFKNSGDQDKIKNNSDKNKQIND